MEGGKFKITLVIFNLSSLSHLTHFQSIIEFFLFFIFLDGKSEHQLSHEELKELRHHEREKRKNIVLWKKPITTLSYFVLESFELIKEEKKK